MYRAHEWVCQSPCWYHLVKVKPGYTLSQAGLYKALIECFFPVRNHLLINRSAPADIPINTEGSMDSYEFATEIEKWSSTISTPERNIRQNKPSHLFWYPESSICIRNNSKMVRKWLCLGENAACDDKITCLKRRARCNNLSNIWVWFFDKYKGEIQLGMKSYGWSPDYITIPKTNTVPLPYFYEMFAGQNHRRINHDSSTNNTSIIDNHHCCRSIFGNSSMNRLLECQWRENTRAYTKKYQHNEKCRTHNRSDL